MNVHPSVRTLALLAASAFVCACSSNSVPSSIPGAAYQARITGRAFSDSAVKAGQVSYVIAVPVTPATLRRARYTSPDTKSLGFTVVKALRGKPVFARTINVAAGSKGCTGMRTFRQCTYTFSMAAGKYFTSVVTYDGLNGKGQQLSIGRSIPLTLKAGQTTTLNLNLNGIPHALMVSSASPSVQGSQTEGFTVYGSTAQGMLVNAVDADGNVIVGAGAPAYAMKILGGTGWTVTSPASKTPNLFEITPPSSGGTPVVVSVTAVTQSDACTEPNALCSTSFSAKAGPPQTLFVGGSGQVLGYSTPYTGTPIAIASGLGTITAMITDSSGNLFVAVCNTSCGKGSSPDAVLEYEPPYTAGAAATITQDVTAPQFLALDASGDIFVVSMTPGGAAGPYAQITAYVPPYTAAPFFTDPEIGTYVGGFGFAPSGALVVAPCGGVHVGYTSCEGGSIGTLDPPSFNSGVSIAGGEDQMYLGTAFDAAGDLFVQSSAPSGRVVEYAAPYTTNQTPAATVSGAGAPLAVDGAGDLYAAMEPLVTKTGMEVFAPPYTGKALATIAVANPTAIVLDAARNAVVVDTDGATWLSASPYSAAPRKIATQIKVTAEAITAPTR